MNPTTESLLKLYTRDLDKLATEIRLYPHEGSIWQVEKGITNPGGNLCLHLCGNLQYFIGAVLGTTGYVRNRDLEFSAKDIASAKLLEEIEKTKVAIATTLPSLTQEQLQATYPMDVLGYPMTTLFFLIHLSAHLGYHLGQVNYHRRLVGSR